jgi:hypothetical protein
MFGNIKVGEDVGAPLLVTGVDLLTLELAPNPLYNEVASYILTGLGYAAGVMRFGGPFVKQLGPCSLPLTARHIYERVKAGGGTSARAGARFALRQRVPVEREYQKGFEQAGAHAY